MRAYSGGTAGNAADTATEGRVGGVVGAILPNEFGEAGDEAAADGQGRLGRDVAWREPGAAGSEHDGSAGGCGAKGGDEDVELVGENEGIEDDGASGGEDLGERGAGEIGLGACRTTVADCNDDDGSAGEGGMRGHVSRIDADERNGAEDEKMERPASFGLVICCSRRNLRRG